MLDETTTNKNSKGFTLIELMIVVAIVGILSAIAVPMYEDYINKTRVLEAITQLKGLQTELEIYWSTHGEYPDEVRRIPVDGYDTTVTDNVRNLHYNHDGAGGKVWVSASLNPATMIGSDAGGDGDRSMTIHIGGIPVNGELKFICGIWAQGDVHSKNIDPAWLPEGCNEPNVGAKLDELVSP